MANNGPTLAYPPPKIVDAIESAGKADPSSAAWAIDLERFYEKQDIAK